MGAPSGTPIILTTFVKQRLTYKLLHPLNANNIKILIPLIPLLPYCLIPFLSFTYSLLPASSLRHATTLEPYH